MSDTDFSAEEIIKSIAADAAALTPADVSTVIAKANEIGKAIEMGDYLTEKRPDLEDDIEDAVGEALAQF